MLLGIASLLMLTLARVAEVVRAGPAPWRLLAVAGTLAGLLYVFDDGDGFVSGEAVLLNELNTMPGFTRTSVYGKLWEASGLPYPDLVDRLCTLAVERHAAERAYRF